MSAFKNVRKVGKWKWSSLHSLHSSLSREEPELTLNLWMLQVELLYDFKENFICREKLFIHTYVFIKPRCQALSIYLLSKSSVLHIQIYIIIHIFAGAWGFNLNSLQHCTQLAYSSTRVKEIRSHCNLCFFLMFFFFFNETLPAKLSPNQYNIFKSIHCADQMYSHWLQSYRETESDDLDFY